MMSRAALSIFFLSSAVLCVAACGSLPERNFNEDNIYADVMGFSDSVTVVPDLNQTHNFYHLTVNATAPGELTQAALIPRISRLPTGQNTAIYYALDRALDRIEMIHGNKPPNAFSASRGTYYYTRYYVILFTDGMDNVSVQLALNNKGDRYTNGDRYAAALRRRMGSLFAGGPRRQNSFEIFLLGLRGGDLRESYTTDELSAHLRSLSASYNGAVHEPIVSDSIDRIYDAFWNAFNASGFSFNIPKGFAENRYRIRMEFAAKGEEGFPHWFEADIRRKILNLWGPYVLTNIVSSPGFTFDSTTLIEAAPGQNKDSLAIQFTISNLKVFDAPLPIASERQLFMDGLWRRNSEYQSISGNYKNAYIVFLMDRSLSLSPEELQKSEEMVINIINLLSGM
jgi:hypothetical protein